MVERAYLSIGDVLSLLREEFPDVTISKIRFLESQGLLDPERTPSGYRKFYEDDVERLRWILRQQRENFLPLKVIRDRLVGDQTDQADDVGSKEGAPAMVTTAAGVAPAPGATSAHTPSGSGATEGGRSPQETPPVTAPATPDPSASRPAPSSQPEEGTRSPALAEGGPSGAAATGGGGASGSGEGGVSRPARASGLPEGRSGADGRHGARREGLAGGPTSVSLTLEELAATSGLSPEALRELERYGLIAGRPVAGTVYYDHEALTVARLAGGFGRLGIEPRHLRMYKTAADREAGFFEQIVMPLLRQRNPAARQRAMETLAELTRLGHDLRASLLRTSLREQTGI